jgi:hypothetical protein
MSVSARIMGKILYPADLSREATYNTLQRHFESVQYDSKYCLSNSSLFDLHLDARRLRPIKIDLGLIGLCEGARDKGFLLSTDS